MSGNNFVSQIGNDLSERIQKAIILKKDNFRKYFSVDINPSSMKHLSFCVYGLNY